MEDLDDDEEASAEDEDSDQEMDPQRLVVTLRYGKGRSPSAQHTPAPASAEPSRLTTVEVVIPKMSQATTISPDPSAPNGYLTPTSTINGTNGSAQPTPQHVHAPPPSDGLPPLNSVLLKKQSQLPFQPLPQHALKPLAPQHPQDQ
jgi:hypothetical protein